MTQEDKNHVLYNGPEHGPAVLILAHGAGAPMDSEFMNSVAQNVGEQGFRVLRFEFPYMVQRRLQNSRRPPDRQPILLQTWLELIERYRDSRPLVIGGKSMGGRMASMVADQAKVSGLACLGYPFHPPGKPEKLRTAHLEHLTTPTLILQGTRDPFGNRDEVARYALSKAIKMFWLEDGDHSFKPRKKSGRTLQQNMAETTKALVTFMGSFIS